MSAGDMSCPVCGAALALDHLFVDADNRAAVARLIEVALPIGARLLQYTRLFTPPKTSLTQRKQVRLVLQLLPDLERLAITHRGRDWAVPMATWSKGIDTILAARDAAKLDLPLKSHAYLYTILVSLADKVEAVQEVQAEQAKAMGVRSPGNGGQITARAAGVCSDPHYTLTPIAALQHAPVPDAIRRQLATLKNIKP